MNSTLKKWRLLVGAATIAVLGASAASAATFDFVSMADNNGDANYIGPTELNWADTAFAAGLNIGGITLIASGTNVAGSFADAFFDKGVAGLGVCSTVGPAAGQSGCATGIGSNTGDDNVSGMAGGETLTLDFGQEVNLSGLIFRAANHSLLNGSVDLTGLGSLVIAGGSIVAGAELLLGQSIFNFEYTGDQFYIASVTANVPLPAGAVLLLSGMGAFGAVARRRRKNAAA